MTAEIAILNLQAVALAADSAITAYPGGNQKIFSSANKLFALSEVAPVGILVYGNASFMSIPWETIVKEYRCILGRKTFAKLHEYANDFCRFLEHHIGDRISDQQQLDYAVRLSQQIFSEIRQEIQQRIDKTIAKAVEESGRFEIEKFAQMEHELTEEVVDEYHSRAKSAPAIEGAPREFERSVRKSLRGHLRSARASVFDQLHLRRGLQQKLNYIAVKAICGFFDEVTRHPPSGFTSGVVVSGFGEQDFFPAISRAHVEGMVQNRLKIHPDKHEVTLNPDNQSAIVPFAQIDMVYQFMEGIAPGYLPYLHRSVVSHLEQYTDDLMRSLSKHSNIETEKLRDVLDQYHTQVADSFMDSVEGFGARFFSQPIMNVVAMLPKEQLAEMAESLVSLTALKRRVSSDEETVGGPTDVALITKGDGLIWIKRKHYFSPELNPSYFDRTSFRRKRYGSDITPVENGAGAQGETSDA